MARPNFIELPTRDLAASQTFFETVFGMTMTGFGPTYACTLTGDVDIGLTGLHSTVQAINQGAPLRVLAAVKQSNEWVFVSNTRTIGGRSGIG